jgi:hypothetical protein
MTFFFTYRIGSIYIRLGSSPWFTTNEPLSMQGIFNFKLLQDTNTTDPKQVSFFAMMSIVKLTSDIIPLKIPLDYVDVLFML